MFSIDKSNGFCDLHTHSIFSDGTISPQKIIKLAEKKNIRAVALCDHNTVAGISEFLAAGENSSTYAVAGIEISSEYIGKELHIVGLFVDAFRICELDEFVSQINKNKEQANIHLAARLCDAGYFVDYEKIKKDAGSITPNRVYFANELIKGGYISTIKEGFKTLLSEKNGFYVPPQRIDAFDAIEFLSSIGALPILAHPLLNLTEQELRVFLSPAKQKGLVAIETIYSLFSDEEICLLEQIADEFGLLKSGGSDFHGENKPDIELGTGKGNLRVPFEYFTALQNAKNSLKNKN